MTFSLIDKAFILKKTRLFGELDLDLLLTIADKTGLAHYEKGQRIFEINEEAHRLYIIVEGIVEIKDEQQQRLALLYTEDFFGDEALFNDRPRAYQATCQSKCTLLTLTETNLLNIISECPSVAVGLLSVYTSIIGFRHR
ncbi:MAG: cyclic nucleotide-binding domain-containing protein [Parachlamydiales bacterium]|nr:cyclic nucleotide-binding domain-containing protein [Parachlamydiales bacterium]